MTVRDDKPTFNLKAVVMETGLKPVTLRAWERRYGLPQPERTSGGHRLYSQRDIDIIKWLSARQDEGLSISQAVAMWHTLVSEGQDPLADAIAQPEPVVAVPAGPISEQMEDLRQAWYKAALAFDEATLERIMAQAFSLFPPETVCLELLQGGLVEIGKGWYRGEVTIQQEHFASAFVMRRLEMLLAAVAPPVRPELILVGCAPEEDHVFGPRLLTYLLRRQGWGVVYLGADVPGDHLGATINQVQPRLVILSAQQLATAANLQEVAHLLQGEDVIVAYGGAVFAMHPSLQARIPAHYLGANLRDVPQRVHALLSGQIKTPTVSALPADYEAALAHYQERRGLLEAHLWDNLKDTPLLTDQLSKLNQQVEQSVIAALKLGQIDLLGKKLEDWWYLSMSYSLAETIIQRYFVEYQRATQRHLDDAGRLITEWLAALNDAA